MDWMKAAALVILLIMYVVMIGFSKWKVYAVAAAALLYLILGILPFSVIPSAINWNVLMMMAGTMILVDYFIVSKMPNRIAEILLDKSTNVMWVTIYMSLFAGVISAFIDNVATVLMVAPVGLAICKKLKISRERYDLIVAETAVEMRNFGLAPEDWPEDEEVDEPCP